MLNAKYSFDFDIIKDYFFSYRIHDMKIIVKANYFERTNEKDNPDLKLNLPRSAKY